jgi:hypothetical protein
LNFDDEDLRSLHPGVVKCLNDVIPSRRRHQNSSTTPHDVVWSDSASSCDGLSFYKALNKIISAAIFSVKMGL